MPTDNICIRRLNRNDKEYIKDIVSIHLSAFQGFFLTFMGRGFLTQMYKSYCEHDESGILVAFENSKPIGFVAYSGDMSGLYKSMIRKRLIPMAWYSTGAFFRKPKAFIRIIRAFLKPKEAVRNENYVELSSIGVSRTAQSKGIGSMLIDKLKETVDFGKYAYINLETDALDNDYANAFYLKNGFLPEREFETHEGRKMNEYRYYGVKK